MSFPAHIFLIISLAIQQAQFRHGVELALANDHVGSEAVLGRLVPLPSQKAQYHYYRLVNAFRLNDKKRATAELSVLEHICTDVPDRYLVTAMLMKGELASWKDDEVLPDIARDMKKVRDRLEHGRAGKETRKFQDDIVARLDKLIKEKEDAASGKGQEDQSDPSKGGKEAKNAAGKPLDQSQLGKDGGTGSVDTVRMRKLAEGWGKLPPREQARALQELTQGMSTRHREGIENYFRNIARTQKK